ncbi:MAG: L,D-transpeptidase family protein [Pseudomonadota bacterium]|nr:L,D-transpeptidase family protein [Pseudomonadota bacterium]
MSANLLNKAAFLRRTLMLIAAAWAWQASAETLVLPPIDVDLVGNIRVTNARQEDTLLDIARRFDVGQDEIVLANPDVDRWLPGADTQVVVPTRYILPRAERTGIVLNVPEMRLYYFPVSAPDQPALVQTYPVSIGRMDWSTPVGTTKVSAKTRNPSWRPPKSIREEAEARGEPLPALIPPGPDNPLGNFALRLARPGYLIHSTNKPFGVGMRVTHGCVRMYPEDIEILFPEVPVGTPVQIADQPIKIGWLFDTLFIEVHPPLEEKKQEPAVLVESAMDLINAAWEQRPLVLDGQALKKALQEQTGIPVPIAQSVRD